MFAQDLERSSLHYGSHSRQAQHTMVENANGVLKRHKVLAVVRASLAQAVCNTLLDLASYISTKRQYVS